MTVHNFNQKKLNNPFDIIEALQERNIVDEISTRKFFIFCAKQVWDLLDEDEKSIVNLAQDYIDKKVSLQQLNNSTQVLFLKKRVHLMGNNTESKYLFGKFSIAMICGYCQNIPPSIRFRRMQRISKGVQLLRMASVKDSSLVKDEIINISNQQVEKLKELYPTIF